MEAFFLGVLGFFATPFFFGAFIIAALWFEYESHTKTGGVFLLILAVLTVSMFGDVVPLRCFGYMALAYIPLGIAWSTIRWGRYSNSLVNDFNEWKKQQQGHSNSSQHSRTVDARERLDYRLELSNNKARVAEWVLTWPISIPVFFLSDTLALIEKVITTYFKSVFTRITDKAKSRIDES